MKILGAFGLFACSCANAFNAGWAIRVDVPAIGAISAATALGFLAGAIAMALRRT